MWLCPGVVWIKPESNGKRKKASTCSMNSLWHRCFVPDFWRPLNKAGLSVPNSLPRKWVVHCTHVGKGLPALKYLSRYLYRGVILENNIVSNKNGNVIFKYVENRTGKICYRTLKRRRLLMARLTTCFTQRLSSGQRLWLFAWQRQEAVIARSDGFACLGWSLHTTFQTGF